MTEEDNSKPSGTRDMSRDTTTITDFILTKDTPTDKREVTNTLTDDTPTFTNEKIKKMSNTTEPDDKYKYNDSDSQLTMSKEDLRRLQRRRERKKMKDKQSGNIESETRTSGKLVERGTQMTETDMSSIMTLSESDSR